MAEEPEPGIFRAANARYRCEDMDRDGVDAELVNGPYEQISAINAACGPYCMSCGISDSTIAMNTAEGIAVSTMPK